MLHLTKDFDEIKLYRQPSLPSSIPHLAIAQVIVIIQGGVQVEVEDPLRAVPVQVYHTLFLGGGGVLLGEGGREGGVSGNKLQRKDNDSLNE